MEYLPYTYLIGWSELNKWYYGVEYALITKIANPDNLWNNYFTSSNIVSFFRENNGEPDIIEIRKIFNKGDFLERMEYAVTWERKVLSKIDITNEKWLNGRIGGDISHEANKKVNMLRYGVENVFQSDEIKSKIKQTLMDRYGVEHPSKSEDIKQTKQNNNFEKYGYCYTQQIPEVKEKSRKTMMLRYGAPTVLQSVILKDKIKDTIERKYGVSNISQIDSVKEKVNIKKAQQYNRDIVKHIKQYSRVFGVKLGCGWYQVSDEKLYNILKDIQITYGTYSYNELINMTLENKYSSSIKKLQDRSIVKLIRQYKKKFRTDIKLGRVWDRKSDEYLKEILSNLIDRYGLLN